MGQEDPLEKEMAWTEEPHGKRSLAGYSPWAANSWTLFVTQHTQSICESCIEVHGDELKISVEREKMQLTTNYVWQYMCVKTIQK